jgi:ribosomal protein L29
MTMKEKTTEQLRDLVAETREKLRGTRFSVAGSTNRNVKEVKNMRKEVARALTELTARSSTTLTAGIK